MPLVKGFRIDYRDHSRRPTTMSSRPRRQGRFRQPTDRRQIITTYAGVASPRGVSTSTALARHGGSPPSMALPRTIMDHADGDARAGPGPPTAKSFGEFPFGVVGGFSRGAAFEDDLRGAPVRVIDFVGMTRRLPHAPLSSRSLVSRLRSCRWPRSPRRSVSCSSIPLMVAMPAAMHACPFLVRVISLARRSAGSGRRTT